MVEIANEQRSQEVPVTLEDIKRVLEVGRLLLSVLTPEELEELRAFNALRSSSSISPEQPSEIGNTSVT